MKLLALCLVLVTQLWMLCACGTVKPRTDAEKFLDEAYLLEGAKKYDAARHAARQAFQVAEPKNAFEAQNFLCASWGRQNLRAQSAQCYLQNMRSLPDTEVRALFFRRGIRAMEVSKRYAASLKLLQEYPNTEAAEELIVGMRRGHLRRLYEELKWSAESKSSRAYGAFLSRTLELVGDANSAAASQIFFDEHNLRHVWWDDVGLALIYYYLKNKNYSALEPIARRLSRSRRSSWFVGSYDRPAQAEAQFVLGKTYEEAGDIKAANRAYRCLLRRFKYSRFRDDAAFRRAWIALEQGDSRRMQNFVEEYPESAWIDRALNRLDMSP